MVVIFVFLGGFSGAELLWSYLVDFHCFFSIKEAWTTDFNQSPVGTVWPVHFCPITTAAVPLSLLKWCESSCVLSPLFSALISSHKWAQMPVTHLPCHVVVPLLATGWQHRARYQSSPSYQCCSSNLPLSSPSLSSPSVTDFWLTSILTKSN